MATPLLRNPATPGRTNATGRQAGRGPQMQLRPDLLIDENLNVSAEGRSYATHEILSTNAI
jgi:hypothetical protein